MTTLPNIETDEIGFIAFYNVIEESDADSIDPEDALSDGSIEQYTLYDNGWSGDFDSVTGRRISVRVKSDGWIVAYMDRTQETGESDEGPEDIPRGNHDLAKNWKVYNDESDLEENTLSEAIESLASELDNWESSIEDQFSQSDVGLYNYEHESSEATTLFSESITSGEGHGFIFTDGTEVNMIVVGVAGENTSNTASGSLSVDYEHPTQGSESILSTGTDSYDHYVASYVDSEDTEHDSEYLIDTGDVSFGNHGVDLLIMWE